jgi:membrane peptidoglycan carboxypeptidase
LNLYLNQSPYGGNIYGVEEASQSYFGKKSSELTLAESAYIAALPQAPSLYSPYTKGKERLEERKNLVLKKMLENNFITETEYSNALKEQVTFLPKSVGAIKAAHFVMYIKEYLSQKYGEKMLENGGFNVISTIDWTLQQKMEEIVFKYIHENESKFKASNGAMVAIDPKTGQILAMVGSRDYFDTKIEGNYNVATARRQPGSAFKPFVYATAFNEGFTPDTPVFDVPTQFNASCDSQNKPLPGSPDAKCYNPQNYEGGFKGVMSFRKALAESRNVPAVKVLHLAGIKESIKTAELMGINNLGTAEQYGLSLALGGGEVSLLDMTEAYGVFANGGKKSKATGILNIKTNDNIEIENFSTSTKEVLPRQTALLMNDVLADPYARSTIFGSRYFGDRQVAIKTGTTNNSRDAWILGYTPSISVGAWMGNNNNTPMVQQASARIIGPMWKEFMDFALKQLPDETFDQPEPTASNTKPYLQGIWQQDGEVHSELFWINRGDPTGATPGYGSKDPLFKLWENGVQNWARTQGFSSSGMITPINNTPIVFTITSPLNNNVLNKNDRININTSGTTIDTSQVEFYINNILIGKSTESPFSFSFIPSLVPGIQDENELKAVQTLKLGKYSESKIYFSVK